MSDSACVVMESVYLLKWIFLWCFVSPSYGLEPSNRYHIDELRLYDVIVPNDTRHKYVRPVTRAGDAVQVEIRLALLAIEDLDIKQQVMKSHIWVKLKWENPFMTWEPADYGDLNKLAVNSDQIWVPDIVPLNSVSESLSRHHDSAALVDHKGEVIWVTQHRLVTSCYMDLTNFPLDQQNCSIKMGSWIYDATKLNLTHWGGPEVDLNYGSAKDDSEWEIHNISIVQHSKMYSCCDDPFQDVTAYVIISRRHSYVIQMFVAPAAVFVLLVPSMFILPPESSQKFILGIGILISQMLLISALGDVIPVSHHSPPRIGLYFLCIVILVSISLAVSSFVANIWNRSKRRSYGVPGCVRVVLLKGLGRLLCLHYDDFLCTDISREQPCDQFQYMTSLDSMSQHSAHSNALDDATMIREYNSHVVNKAEWRQLAAIVDRIFCLLFWIISVLTVVAMLIQF